MIKISTAVVASFALLALSACATTTSTETATPAPAAPAAAPAAPAAPAAMANAAAIEAGQSTFQTRCAGCHREGASAPSPAALKGFGHAKIVEALTTGKMMRQGSSLTADDKSNVATFLTK